MRKPPGGIIAIAAWVAMIGLAYATLTRAGFVNSIYSQLSPILMTPDVKTYGLIVHTAAFVVFGALFTIAYPRRLLLVFTMVIGGAIALEVLQTLTQDRHGTIIDALEKVAGGAAGIAVTLMAGRLAEKRRGSTLPSNDRRPGF